VNEAENVMVWEFEPVRCWTCSIIFYREEGKKEIVHCINCRNRGEKLL
jgi:hypothetical protein